MTLALEGQRVLFFCPPFFGYFQDIVGEIERLGGVVQYYNERPSTNFIVKALIRFYPGFIKGLVDRYYHKVCKELVGQYFDSILIVDPESISKSAVALLQKTFPGARIKFYCWDSIANKPNIWNLIEGGHEVFSFDPDDSQRYPGVKNLSLFYGHDFEKIGRIPPPGERIDLCCIATGHSDRINVIRKIQDQARLAGRTVETHIYLQNVFVFLFYKVTSPVFKGVHLRDVRFTPVTRVELIDAYSRCKAMVDIHHPRQNGLTIRTFECFGAHRKLLTTNGGIEKYDFFDEHQHQVIDRNNPQVDFGFLDVAVEFTDSNIYRKYSIESFVLSLLGSDHKEFVS